MGRKIEPGLLATAGAVMDTAGSPAIATGAGPAQPAAPVKPVAAAAAAAVAEPGATRPRAARKPRSALAPAAAASPLAAVKAAQESGADKPAAAGKGDKPQAPAEPARDKDKDEKAHAKPKLVRDSFTMPRADFALIALLKDRALGFRRPVKKSELLRAGLQALAALDDDRLQAALAALAPVKAGRPKKG